MLIDVDVSSSFLSRFLDTSQKREDTTKQADDKSGPKRKSLMERLRSIHGTECTTDTGIACYNPQVHGPLVDLTWKPVAGIEQIEVYPVNEPFAYVRILYDNDTLEYTYGFSSRS